MALILLISRERAAMSWARTALMATGHEVVMAETRSEAIAVKRHFDLALLDIELSSLAGDLARVARKVVLHTGMTQELTARVVTATGVTGYIRKLGPYRFLEDLGHHLGLAT
jgi:DNA-binding response OmpR family regulator